MSGRPKDTPRPDEEERRGSEPVRYEDRLRARKGRGSEDRYSWLYNAEVDALADAIEALRRVEEKLVPNHDAANEVAQKFGLGPIGAVEFVVAIREVLARLDGLGG